MILTGPEIRERIGRGHITIDPFLPELCKIESYNYRLGPILKVFRDVDDHGQPIFEEVLIPEEGYVLPKATVTLGHTAEVIGSSHFAMSLIGRSSLGRLGLFLQVDADLGHTTSCHQWTLELVAAMPLRVYSGMVIGQVTFWCNEGEVTRYDGGYGRENDPTESRLLTSRNGGTR